MKKILISVTIIFTLLLIFLFWFNTPFRYITFGEAEIKRDKIANAVRIFEQGVEKFPTNTMLIYCLAKSYLKLEEIEKANELVLDDRFYETFATNRLYKDFLIDLAEANKKFGNEDLAIMLAEEYLKNEDESLVSPRIINNYIRISQILDKKSLDLLEKSYNLAETTGAKNLKKRIITLLIPKYFELAEEYNLSESYESALTILNKIEFLNDSPRGHFEKGKIYFKLNKTNLAQTEFESAIDKDPTNDDYKIGYAQALEEAAKNTDDELKKKEFREKITLLLADDTNNSKKSDVLKKLMNFNSKFKISNVAVFLKEVGEGFYPTIEFQITELPDYTLEEYKVVFLNDNKETIDTYVSKITKDKLNQPIAVTSKNPIENDSLIYAKLYINNEFVKEY